MPSENIKEIQVFQDRPMSFTTSSTPLEQTLLFDARSRGGFRINTPQASENILVYYYDYPGGEAVPFHIIPPQSGAVWDNIISRDGVARGYMGRVYVASPGADQIISVVEYKPGS